MHFGSPDIYGTPPQKKRKHPTPSFLFHILMCHWGSSSPPAHPASQSTTSRSCLKRPSLDVSWSKRLEVLESHEWESGFLIQRTVAYIIYLYQLETRLFTIKTTKNVAFGGPWYKYTSRIRTCLCFVFRGWTLQEGPNSDQNKGLHLRIGLAVSPGDGFFCGWQVMVSWIPRKYCI